ncbi:hypothetical protein ANN_15128 [Periplaneta americana]|uniref:Uncharacterized protein n=1 Tax=Periplaneta americana TaxID=6978 RepID=A0ABQ8SZM5_PERAM|nr:hypothetical protein ANN_15128 [Periplaneta americana]
MLAGNEFQSLRRANVKEDEYEEVRWDGIVSIVSWRERVFRLWWEERRADIIIIDGQKDKGVILDPTVRFEMHEQQPQEVCREKQVIYEPCCQHLGAQYHITHWTVFGLMFGARGTIPRETLNQLKQYKISDATIDAIGSHVLKSSLAIISNHLEVSRGAILSASVEIPSIVVSGKCGLTNKKRVAFEDSSSCWYWTASSSCESAAHRSLGFDTRVNLSSVQAEATQLEVLSSSAVEGQSRYADPNVMKILPTEAIFISRFVRHEVWKIFTPETCKHFEKVNDGDDKFLRNVGLSFLHDAAHSKDPDITMTGVKAPVGRFICFATQDSKPSCTNSNNPSQRSKNVG